MPRENVQSFLDELQADPDYPVYERLAAIGGAMAERIEKLRKDKGMTQADLASAMRTKQSRISLMEDPTYCGYTLDTMVRLSIALECGISDLLSEPAPKYQILGSFFGGPSIEGVGVLASAVHTDLRAEIPCPTKAEKRKPRSLQTFLSFVQFRSEHLHESRNESRKMTTKSKQPKSPKKVLYSENVAPLEGLLTKGWANISHDAILGADRSISLVRIIDMAAPPAFPFAFPRFFFCPEFSIKTSADIGEIKFVVELENPKKKVFQLGDIACKFGDVPFGQVRLVRLPLEIAGTFSINSYGEYTFRLVAVRGKERMVVAERLMQVIEPPKNQLVEQKAKAVKAPKSEKKSARKK